MINLNLVIRVNHQRLFAKYTNHEIITIFILTNNR